ncbi:MAG: LysR family transcriptional regulator, partial [Pseudomonadota bacterium]
MQYWNEIRTAACVAQLRTISAAAETLGVHRSTVVRHIEKLEEEFGVKLFLRD